MKFKAGDTLSAIAKQNGTTVSKIMAANPSIKNANSIQAGASYKLPPKINSGANKISSPNLNIRSSSNNKSTSAVTKTDNQPLGSGKTSFLKSELSKMGKDAKKAFNETKRNFGIKSSNDNNSSKKPSWFDKIIKETKRNFGPGKNKLVTEGTSNITNSSTFKDKKEDKKDYKSGSYKSGYSEMGSGVRNTKKLAVPEPKLRPDNLKKKKKKLPKQMSA